MWQALETESNLYGTTTNPFNSGLTPGGSSGGEAALIAMRGSLLGIGTDIGENKLTGSSEAVRHTDLFQVARSACPAPFVVSSGSSRV